MARSKNNILLSEFGGRIGNLVVKSYSYGTVISKLPDMSNAGKTEKQSGTRLKFKAAQAYAKHIINDPEKKQAMQKQLKPGESVYHAAISIYMKSDASGEVDLLKLK